MSSLPKKPDEPEREVGSASEPGAAASPDEPVGESSAPPSAEEGVSVEAEAFFGSAPEAIEDQVTRYARRPPAWRSPGLLLLVIGISAWLLWSMRADLAYFMADPEPVSLGDIESYDLSGAEPNAYVYIEGLPHHLQAQYKQLGTRYKVYPLIGTRIFVREHLSEETKPTSEYPSFEGSGRLLDIRGERTYANVRAFFAERGRFDFQEPAWILLEGQKPRRAFWVPVAYLVLSGILLLNLRLLGRRLLQRRKAG